MRLGRLRRVLLQEGLEPSARAVVRLLGLGFLLEVLKVLVRP